MWRDMERTCARLGLPFRQPSQFPRSGLLAARVACTYDAEPWTADFIEAVYAANFGDDRDITSASVVRSCLNDVGIDAGDDADAIIDAAQSPDGKARLRAQTERAAALGIFGAPTFIADGELFWGQDRIDEALSWCERGTA